MLPLWKCCQFQCCQSQICPVVFFERVHQAEVALLDEVVEAEPAVAEVAGDADDQLQVAFDDPHPLPEQGFVLTAKIADERDRFVGRGGEFVAQQLETFAILGGRRERSRHNYIQSYYR